jgi:type IV pilus assembly protein PilX
MNSIPKHPLRNFRSGPRSLRRQAGVILIITLIALVAMTLAAVALVRSVDTGTIVAGNLGFKQSAVVSGDAGLEAARAWLLVNATLLASDSSNNGYYATRQDSVDFTGARTPAVTTDNVDWDGTNGSSVSKARKVNSGTADNAGNVVSYVIHRMCDIPGGINDPGQACATATIDATGSPKDAPDYSKYGLQSSKLVYYRVTSRVLGPRNTITYVQSMLVL